MTDAPATAVAADVDSPQTPLLHLIRDIYNRNCNLAALSAEQRQSVVAHLTQEGYSVAEMAVLLQCSERTIERDRAAAREADALTIDAKLTRQIAGELMRQAQSTTARLRRVARDQNTPVNIRIMAEDRTFRILRDLLTTLVNVGLPAADTQDPAFTSKLIELIRRELAAKGETAAAQ